MNSKYLELELKIKGGDQLESLNTPSLGNLDLNKIDKIFDDSIKKSVKVYEKYQNVLSKKLLEEF